MALVMHDVTFEGAAYAGGGTVLVYIFWGLAESRIKSIYINSNVALNSAYSHHKSG